MLLANFLLQWNMFNDMEGGGGGGGGGGGQGLDKSFNTTSIEGRSIHNGTDTYSTNFHYSGFSCIIMLKWVQIYWLD